MEAFAFDGKFTSKDYIHCRKVLTQTWRPLASKHDLSLHDLACPAAVEGKSRSRENNKCDDDKFSSCTSDAGSYTDVYSCSQAEILSQGQDAECDDDNKRDHASIAVVSDFDFRSSLSPDFKIHDASVHGSIAEFALHRVERKLETGSFLICNLSTVEDQFRIWKKELPMVEPFYAVKCHPDPVIVRLLAKLGCGFDCATMGEIDLVLNGLGDELNFGSSGKASNNIVYANPAKMEEHLQFAVRNNVRMTVFDGEDELYKIASIPGCENFDLLLRLSTDDRASICRFSKKFGCPVEESEHLLKIAKELGLRVVGVSFHVGSGCGDPAAYTTALSHSKIVFSTAEKLGMETMNLVDIGGGFPGDVGGYGGDGMPDFYELASTVRSGIEWFLTSLKRDDVRFIAEPGRYFVSACTTVVTKIYGRKGGDKEYQALYVDDGVYGSFNNIIYDHANPTPVKLTALAERFHRERLGVKDEFPEKAIPTAIFGPTCDGLDQMCSLESTVLGRCNIGDWLLWDNMGAYTHTASFIFNGYTHIPNKVYCTM